MYRKEKRKQWKAERKVRSQKVRKIAGVCGDKYEMKQKHGYGMYFAKVQEEIKRAEVRRKFICVLNAIGDTKREHCLELVKPILKRMEQELITLGKVPPIHKTKAVINYCISMFEIISRAQDELDGIFVCAPVGEGKQKAFEEFINDLYYGGRHTPKDLRNDTTYGKVPYWNTTIKGEPINADTIKFGPEIGEKSKPASYWLQLSTKKKSTLIYKNAGKLQTVSIWKTDLIVRSGVHNVCNKLVEFLLDELNILLS